MWLPKKSSAMQQWKMNTDPQKETRRMNTPQVPTSHMKALQFATQFQFFKISLILISAWPLRALAQDSHSHTTQQQQELTPEQQSQQSALLKIVREPTARFQDVRMAESEGYRLEFGCVSGPDSGAMGLHSVNDTLVGNGIVDATRPQIVLYKAQPNGDLKLTGADYLVLASPWDAKHSGKPPELMGQISHYFESPNRFGLPAFYTLHGWAWKANPNGAFVNWHPHVSCQSFVGQTAP
jgi:hypothetical protein